ncbi:MAG TPA: MOSC domain-containing protein [Candidatus Cybelea sp.]|nr:MOSC domain-containing protein [Candidatus Cybelea sp.]
MEQIGTVIALRRYPVKSMAGEDLDEARITFAGIMGDRVYAFVDPQNKTDFPWWTGRQAHEMIRFEPHFTHGLPSKEEFPDRDQFSVDVRGFDGQTFRMGEEGFTRHLEEKFGRSLRLRFSERNMTDSRPVSLLGLSTIRALSDELGFELDRRRFRENLYVEWNDPRPFFEDGLLGRRLQIGETVMLEVVKRDQRCVIITLDPDTAQARPEILGLVARRHEGSVGVYATVLREGIVRTRDPICTV